MSVFTDKELTDRLKGYRRAVAKRYTVVRPDEITKRLAGDCLRISTKIDGELWFLVKRSGQVALVAPNGRVLQNARITTYAAGILRGHGDTLIVGELYVPGREWSRARVHDVSTALAGDTTRLAFGAFDLLDEGSTDWYAKPYMDRCERLVYLFGFGGYCHAVRSTVGCPMDVLDTYQSRVVEGGAEGLVVRSEMGRIYKIKPEMTVDAVIVAYSELDGEAREFTLALVRDDGTYQLLGTVSSGPTDAERVEWARRLGGMVMPSAYAVASKTGMLQTWVEPGIVVEVRCNDILTEGSDAKPIRKPAMVYSGIYGWADAGLMPIASLISPVLVRERLDKSADAVEAGLAQVDRVVPVARVHEVVKPETLPASEVLSREVWTKTVKGAVAVRKYVTIATHKAALEAGYPAYVLFTTDYSEGRAEPLKTGLKVTSSREHLVQMTVNWYTANIKRGWTPANEEA